VEQIKAMPSPEPRTAQRDVTGRPEISKPPRKPKPASKPKRSSVKRETAEAALVTAAANYGGMINELADREAKLAPERRDLEEQHRTDVAAAEATVEAKRERYDATMR